MHPAEQLAAECTRGHLKLAEQLRYARRLRRLRRARRMELRAERRMITAWRRAAELRDAAEPADWRLSEPPGLVAVVVLDGVRRSRSSRTGVRRD
jgi:hypothetical protein